MTQSPALQLEAKANREAAKLVKAKEDLRLVHATISHSDLPPEIKLRLAGAIRREADLLDAEAVKIEGFREAAQLSRGRQWVTSGDL